MADEIIASTSSSVVSPQLTRKGILGECPALDPHRPGFFAGAKNIDASRGVFTDVAGDVINIARDVNVKIETQVCCGVFEQLNND